MKSSLPDLSAELQFKTTRSGGAGGQNVNKVETRVELYFNVKNSALLSANQKTQILEKLKNKITHEGVLMVTAQRARTQLTNKKTAEKRLYEWLEMALKQQKKRIPSKPSKAAREKRLNEKKQLAEKKLRRATKDDI